MYDLLIHGGTIVDGSGGETYCADVAVNGDRIVAIGQDLGAAKERLDASGCYVTPGFVDIHTHYDGQATWDQEMAPSSWHGVTTVVMGNCGVGFAPAAPDRHEWLIGLMEGVEDIPGSALSEGMSWNWESFPEYLDALEGLARSVDVAPRYPMALCVLTSWGTEAPLMKRQQIPTLLACRLLLRKVCARVHWVFRPRAPRCINPSTGS